MIIFAALPVGDPPGQMLINRIGLLIFRLFFVCIGKIQCKIFLQFLIVLFGLLFCKNIMGQEHDVFLRSRCLPFDISGKVEPEQFRTVGFHLF